MATENVLFRDSACVAAADYNTVSKQFYIMKLTAATEDSVTLPNNAADVPYGVLYNNPKAGEPAEVAKGGIVRVITDGTANGGIAVGDPVGTDGNGKAVHKSANKDLIIGRALQPSTADGTIIAVDFGLGVLNL